MAGRIHGRLEYDAGLCGQAVFVRSSDGSKITGGWKRLPGNDVAFSSCPRYPSPEVRHQALLEV